MSRSYILAFCVALRQCHAQAVVPSVYNSSIKPSDTIPSYLANYGIPVEEHWTTTEDGYILKLFRLARPGAPVVLGQHGILCTSWHWLINDPALSPGIQLFEQGYDVWLTNSRGNTFSKNHTTLNPLLSKKFWNFSWVEMGRFDVPTNIAYVLKETGKETLTFAGWSQGTTQFFVAMTDDKVKAYVDKTVNLFVAIAPVTWMKNSKSALLNALVTFDLDKVLDDLYPYGFLGGADVPEIAHFFCKVTFGAICEITVDIIAGRSKLDVAAAITNLTAHFPAGSSVKGIEHYAQSIRHGYFREYDYGKKRNLKEYGQITPPEFDISKIGVPTALFVGEKDDMGDVKDNEILESHMQGLPALIYSKVFPDFSHTTFFTGTKGAFNSWFPDLQALLEKYNPLPGKLVV